MINRRNFIKKMTALGFGGLVYPYFDALAKDGFPTVSKAKRPSNILLISLDTLKVKRLTVSRGVDSDPVWSPKGDRIAFRSYLDGNAEIFTMDTNGGSLTRITNNLAEDFIPVWSPDATRIAFRSFRDGEDWELFVVNADGTGLMRLSDNIAFDGYPSWSPDGLHIVYQSDESGDNELYITNADGSGFVRLTFSINTFDGYAKWRP